MGTSNFTYGNTSCLYTVETTYFNEETEEYCFDKFIHEDTISIISNSLEGIEKENKSLSWFEDNDIKVKGYHDRNYPAMSIGELSIEFDYLGIGFYIRIIPKTVAGYYSGFSLDYDIEIIMDDDTFDNVDDAIKCIEEYYVGDEINKGLWSIHGWQLERKLNDTISEMCNIVEDVFKQYSEPLGVVGRFSNGETIYKRCNEAS